MDGSGAAHLTAIAEGEDIGAAEGWPSDVVPLGKLLRQAREEPMRRERQRLVDNFSPATQGFWRLVDNLGPATQSSHSEVGHKHHSTTQSSSFGRQATARTAGRPVVIHRHHHHHYHHHYEPGRDDWPEGEPREGDLDVVDLLASPLRHAADSRADPRPGRKSGVEHLHCHHHAREEGMPPNAHKLIHDARKAARGRFDAGPGAAAGDGAAGPDTRLPRLA
uniref:Uncharacterized protein n=1 Tax=Zooxanthella nutricula TaxID=1333877 RepID=A0A7S2QNW8_9DINO